MELEKRLKQKKSQYLETLFELLRFKSVSTLSSHKKDINDCANYILNYFQKIGLDSEIYQTKGHPLVFAQTKQDPNKKTVLVYGHYDVQPADPYDLWHSDPFEPECRDGYIYARGASDDKGQFFTHICALDLLQEQGELPVNLKFLIEGEEEISSPNIDDFLAVHQNKLSCDLVLVSDTPMYNEETPSICYSWRGMLYTELTVYGPNRDIHSGQLGGIVQNPINALAHLISKLKDEQNKVLIPGFYDDVPRLTKKQETFLKQCVSTDEMVKNELELSDLVCEDGFDSNACKWFRPTLDCNGIVGGYIEEGAKTIIPAKASSKISMRLVGYQDPLNELEKLKRYLFSIVPKGVDLELNVLSTGKPYFLDPDNMYLAKALIAVEQAFGKKGVLQGEGGSIPIINDFKDRLNVETVLMGFNLPNDNIHSPNERFLESSFYSGILASCYFLTSV